MFVSALMMLASVAAMENYAGDPVADQLINFKDRTEGPVGVLTTSDGAPVPYDEATNTLNMPLINNEYFMDMITHLTRERTPERVVHAKGTGAFGYFEVTNDISRICKADFLKKGRKTPVAVRFSTSRGSRGSTELDVDTRGFAVKFYTREGNFDIIGFNTPMYFYNDPLHTLPILRGSRANPVTNVADPNLRWDRFTLIPETLHLTMLVLSGRGIPATYRNMPGFSIHTYQVENDQGVQHFVRVHILPDDGIKNFDLLEARRISATDSDYLTKDLYQSIANGDYPSWTVNVQILTTEDVKKFGYKVFDATRVIPLDEFPLHQVGKIVLNRNAKNFFAEIEQLAFCPGNLVPGIHGAPDKLFESRRLAYRDTQIHRLGGNFKKIPVNCPFQVRTFTYNRDGMPPVGDNEEDIPNYYPNSFHGPVPYMRKPSPGLIKIIERKADNFDQAAELYANELTTAERNQLISTLVFELGATAKFIQNRAIRLFTNIHPDLGLRLAQGLNSTI